MAAFTCDVFSFCVGVAGRARTAVEVRFVNSSKVRPGRTLPGAPTPSGLKYSRTGPYAWSLEASLPFGRCGPGLARDRGAPRLSQHKGFRGRHAVDRDLQSLRAHPLLAEPGPALRRPECGCARRGWEGARTSGPRLVDPAAGPREHWVGRF